MGNLVDKKNYKLDHAMHSNAYSVQVSKNIDRYEDLQKNK